VIPRFQQNNSSRASVVAERPALNTTLSDNAMPAEFTGPNDPRLQAFIGRKRHGCGGKNSHPLYEVWKGMKQRCANPKHKGWSIYGGRGICVCERWQLFDNFLSDMLPGYRPGLCIERKDNDGPYSPENCRWATRFEQMRNTRVNHIVSFNGESLHLVDWAKKVGLYPGTLHYRLAVGWSVARALTEPSREAK
jgi:hypothetical protein